MESLEKLQRKIDIMKGRIEQAAIKKQDLHEKHGTLQKVLAEDPAPTQLHKLNSHKAEIVELTNRINAKMLSLKERANMLKVHNAEKDQNLQRLQLKAGEISQKEEVLHKIDEEKAYLEELEKKLKARSDEIRINQYKVDAIKSKLCLRNLQLEQKGNKLEEESSLTDTQKSSQLMQKEEEVNSLLALVEEKENELIKREISLAQKEAQIAAILSIDMEIESKTEEFQQSSEQWRKHKEKFNRSLLESYKRLKSKEKSLGKFENLQSLQRVNSNVVST
eukprot:TRINITY_DN953_c0_g1_i1.p4 TRINITY_DN953_c0_g1~~TRINITY_DN953_c0_g1_i1.p4  ORF type:complete len:278 (+),score=51.30 TRINITY_DN953_c0_g1_i1:1758-2591(+)